MGIDIFATAFCRESTHVTLERAAYFFSSLPPLLPDCPVRVHVNEDGSVHANVFMENWIFIGQDDGRISFSARTSNGGPGYHAHVVELMDGLAKNAGLTWVVEDEEGIGDETGYYEHRDFAELKSSMAGFARTLTSIVRNSPVPSGKNPQTKSEEPITLCMPLEWTPIGDYYASHPLGSFSKEELEAFSADEVYETTLERFFPWWGASYQVGFWRRKWKHPASFHHAHALWLIWNRINWLPPIFPEEKGYLLSALDSLKAAWRLDPNREYPVAEWLEIAELAGETRVRDSIASRFPDAPHEGGQRKGYLRGTIKRQFGPWSLHCGGMAHVSHNQGNGLTSFANEEHEIKIIAYSHFEEDGTTPLSAKKRIAALKKEGLFPYTEQFKPGIPGVQAWINEGGSEEAGRAEFYTHCMAIADGTSIVLFAYYPDKKHRKDIHQLLQTLRYKKAGATAAAPES